MIREYIIKISDEVLDDEFSDKPQELIRCRDCNYWRNKACYCRVVVCPQPDAEWFCADGVRTEDVHQ